MIKFLRDFFFPSKLCKGDYVYLKRNIPAAGLEKGDIGLITKVYRKILKGHDLYQLNFSSDVIGYDRRYIRSTVVVDKDIELAKGQLRNVKQSD